MGVYDVSASLLIKEIAADLKKQGIQQPEWAMFVKTGAHRERAPDNPGWFFERTASVLYRIYKDGPLGTESLRSYYGGKRRKKTERPHKKKAGGKILRVCLQTLEKQGLIKKSKKGRVVTGKGQSYLNRKAKEVSALRVEKPKPREEKKHEEKTEQEKKVEAELKKIDDAEKVKEKAAEAERKKQEKKPAKAEEGSEKPTKGDEGKEKAAEEK